MPSLSLLLELVRKDLRLFVADRRALIISFAVPVLIASFLAVLFGNMGSTSTGGGTKVVVAVANEDTGPVSAAIGDRLRKRKDNLDVRFLSADAARKSVREGTASYAIVLPKGFGDRAVAAMGAANGGPEFESIADPARQIEAQVARGAVIQAIMGAVVAQKFGGFGVSADRMPFTERAGTIAADSAGRVDSDVKYDGVAHAFCGMAMQGLLFWAIESAMVILRERRQGIWRRLRASPVTPAMLLLGKLLSGALRAMMILAVVFGAGALIFRMRVEGSWVGFALIGASAALMASAFGLFVAALGRTEQQSRGLSILAVLTMMMLGGAWFPSFLMPAWIQNVALVIPVRWAVDGFDGMTWRAQGMAQAMPYVAVLSGFTLIFALVAIKRIRWEYEA